MMRLNKLFSILQQENQRCSLISWRLLSGILIITALALVSCEGPVGPQGNPGLDGLDGQDGARGEKGDKGDPGASGSVINIGENGNWIIDGVDTGKRALGATGETGAAGAPGSVVTVGDNGNWFIDETDTGIKAQGPKGEDGVAGTLQGELSIGENGNWIIDGVDTGKSALGATGEAGAAGAPGTVITIGENGNWFLDGVDSGKSSQGKPGISIVWKGEHTEAPSDAELNWAYFNTALGNAYIYDGAAWVLLSQRGTDGVNGSDGVSLVWKGPLTSAPENPEPNWAYYNSTDKISYIWDGSSWQILVKDGVVGPEGPQGPQGEPGKDGQNGDDGQPGANGDTPYIGGNGNWWIGTTDTGMPAQGQSAVDYEDFGPGAVVSGTFTVTSQAEWDSAVSAIKAGGDGKNYVIYVSGDFTVPGSTDYTFGSVSDIKVSIRQIEGHSIGLASAGNLLKIPTGQTIILRDLTLKGMISNNASLVFIDGGTFNMYDSAEVSGNTFSSSSSSVDSSGGGVYVSNDGTFNMYDSSSVRSNTTTSSSAFSYGGGVYVGRGIFNMYDSAEVSGNTSFSSSSVSASLGGGVYVATKDPMDLGTFTMNDRATVRDNTVSFSTPTGTKNCYSRGGGVSLAYKGHFYMNDFASVRDNTSDSTHVAEGGGVCVDNWGNLYMNDNASISGNSASSSLTYYPNDYGYRYYSTGGGVCISDGHLFFRGGVIYGNTSGADSNVVKEEGVNRGGGAALGIKSGPGATSGTWSEDGRVWTIKADLITTDNTLKVANGVVLEGEFSDPFSF